MTSQEERDIVTKLMSPAMVFYEYECDDGALIKEAADTIERLRKENRVLAANWSNAYAEVRDLRRRLDPIELTSDME